MTAWILWLLLYWPCVHVTLYVRALHCSLLGLTITPMPDTWETAVHYFVWVIISGWLYSHFKNSPTDH